MAPFYPRMTAAAPIRALEERCLNAWPARKTVLLGGWVVRLSDGFSKRANSATALDPVGDFRAVLPEVEALYVRHGQPPVFRLTPLAGAGADSVLEQAGYRRIDETLVMVRAPAADVGAPDPAVRMVHAPEPWWLAGVDAAKAIPEARRAAHRRVMETIAPPAAFAALELDGRPVAFGMAVLDRGMVGLFDIVVDEPLRGRGFGRRITRALLGWGAGMGASGAYLQVVADNAVAVSLYRSMGFAEAYRHHYQVGPAD